MGLGVLSPFRQINRENAHAAPVLLDRRRLFTPSNVRGAARRFLRVIATDTRRFRRAMRRDIHRAFVVLRCPSKITVTSALHDCLRHGEPHVRTETFRMEKIHIPATGQQES